jgi:hypothetical protein
MGRADCAGLIAPSTKTTAVSILLLPAIGLGIKSVAPIVQ